MATLDLYKQEDLFARAKKPRAALVRCRDVAQGLPNVLDIRTVGLTCGYRPCLAIPDAYGKRAFDVASHIGLP
jgi:beta-alanine--pyruvate transaminase